MGPNDLFPTETLPAEKCIIFLRTPELSMEILFQISHLRRISVYSASCSTPLAEGVKVILGHTGPLIPLPDYPWGRSERAGDGRPRRCQGSWSEKRVPFARGEVVWKLSNRLTLGSGACGHQWPFQYQKQWCQSAMRTPSLVALLWAWCPTVYFYMW